VAFNVYLLLFLHIPVLTCTFFKALFNNNIVVVGYYAYTDAFIFNFSLFELFLSAIVSYTYVYILFVVYGFIKAPVATSLIGPDAKDCI